MLNLADGAVLSGLSSAEAARRLAQYGPNSVPEQGRRGWCSLLAGAAREPMFLMLAVAAALYLLLGELHEGLVLAATVVLTMGLTLYQQGRTERALQTLRQLGAPTALVLRDGARVALPSAQLVPGDVIALAEGDRVPADAVLLAANGLRTDESMLTGESEPVGKLAGAPGPAAPKPGGDGLTWVYSGTLVVQGHGLAQVAATGAASEIGRLGAALATVAPPPSPLQRETALLARRLAALGLALSATLVLLLGSRDGAWISALLAGLALAMSMLPEEIPVILTVFPALGAHRLARHKVLARNLGAIETLGAASVLCVDKTGTLTENRMSVGRIWAGGRMLAPADGTLPAESVVVLRAAILASRPKSADPMEQAFFRLAERAGLPSFPAGMQPVREYGLTPERPALVQLWSEMDGSMRVAAKGAPEYMLPLCGLNGEQRGAALQALGQMTALGLRVLVVATGRHAGASWPEDPAAFRLELCGLVGLADPLRAGTSAAVADCQAAGVRVLMITGDHPDTAGAIARQAGIAGGAVLTGPQMDAMDEAQLEQALREASVCARARPEQKLRIVRALQRGGAVVAMTGDGVNDAPALRAANVGVAMGMRGTDVAREAAELTLLDDHFASIVAAICGGRRIYSNMRKAMQYVLAIHAPIAGMALLPALFGWPVLLFPMHIVFLELIIDPACSLVFEQEPAEHGLMRRPPRPAGAAFIDRPALLRALLQGGAVLATLALAYGSAAALLPEQEARSCGFAALVLSNLALLQAKRRPVGHPRNANCAHSSAGAGTADGARPARNPASVAITGAAAGMLLAAIYWPPLATAFKMAPLALPALAAACGCSVLVYVLLRTFERHGAPSQRTRQVDCLY
ncbi:cation-translocating P-type ATPase [Pseudoduganella sp. UC29_71]|uniref:cation-translocating P-type ATPase n=1 Tax=Pseudoduganella sp. UC29_71 TaxID=3350174 RepID=UPI00366D9AF7